MGQHLIDGADGTTDGAELHRITDRIKYEQNTVETDDSRNSIIDEAVKSCLPLH